MSFNDLPIRRKVMTVIMLTSVIVLLLTTGAFTLYDIVSYRLRIGSHLATTGSILSASCAPALNAEDSLAASNALAALEANPMVLRAAIYDERGMPLAHYPARESVGLFPILPGRLGQRTEGGKLTLFMPIVAEGRRLGTIYLEAAAPPLQARLVSFGEIALLVLAGSGLVAFFVSRSLQRHISEPILTLAHTARVISEHGDLSLRERRTSADEFGILADAFNTMLQRLEEAERAHSFLAAIVQSSDAAVVGKDLEGRILSWNSGAERMFGYTETEMLGKTVERLLAPDRPDEEARILAQARQGRVCSCETVRMRKGGQPVDVSLIISPIRNRLGKIIGVSSIMRDIGERKRAQQEVLKLCADMEQRVETRTAELTAANKELEAFTYSVAHDLRAPLRHIDAFARILQEEVGTGLDGEMAAYLEGIRQSSRNMAQLVDDLLNLARIGRQELQRQPCSLGPLVEEVVAELRAEAAGRDIDWRIRALPTVDADYRLLKQVLANLLSNAVKYTRPRDKAVIEIGSIETQGSPTIYVRDNGVGFNMRYVRKLFGVFQRLHRSEEFEGTGVGLAIVDRIIRKHGGCVWAEGAPDKGAVFYFTVPAGQDSPASPPPESESEVTTLVAGAPSPVTAWQPQPSVR